MYQAINAILVNRDADAGVAEAHGIATGMLSVELKADAANWLRELFAEEHALQDDEKASLLNLFERTRELLDPESEEFAFDLFLPDEDELLSDRAEALRSWCQGFLFGVGYAPAAEWPGDVAEVMRDMVELTKIDSNVEGEANEAALAEIHEYVRVAVLTVRDLLIEQQNAQSH
ncbi:UPF0149 family protein [Methylomonas sp. MgM2]